MLPAFLGAFLGALVAIVFACWLYLVIEREDK